MKRLSTPSELQAAIDGNKHSSLGYVLTYIKSPKEKEKGHIMLGIRFFYENTFSGSPIKRISGSIPLDF